MPTKRIIAGGTYEYCTVFVGVQMDTQKVQRVWMGADGGMTDGVVLRHPAPGMTVAGTLITVYGLTKTCKFPASDLLAAAHYAAKLRKDQSRDRNHDRSVL